MAIHNDPAAIRTLYDAKVRDAGGLNALLAGRDGLMFNHNGLVLPDRRVDLSAALDDGARLVLLHDLEIDLVRFGIEYLGEIEPTDRVLDAGCGGGGGSILIAERFGCSVEGVTLSDEQARFATHAAETRGVRAQFTVADMAAYSRQAGPFDAIWACESTEHVDSLPALLTSFGDGLEPGARVVIIAWCAGDGPEADELKAQVDAHYRTNIHTPQAYRAAARDAGLDVVDEVDLTPLTTPYWQIRAGSEHATGSERFMTPAFEGGRLTYWLFALQAA